MGSSKPKNNSGVTRVPEVPELKETNLSETATETETETTAPVTAVKEKKPRKPRTEKKKTKVSLKILCLKLDEKIGALQTKMDNLRDQKAELENEIEDFDRAEE